MSELYMQPNGEWPTDFDGLRAMAVDATKPVLSRRLLDKMPRLVAHHSMSGVAGMAYSDFDLGGAVCCTAEEGMLLYYLARNARPLNPLEIGCYVGWSTAHLLAGLTAWLHIVDPFSEVAKAVTRDVGAQNAADLVRDRVGRNLLACELTSYDIHTDPSPFVLNAIAPAVGWDFVFLDGEHNQGQPARDVEGLLPHLQDDATVILHDGWHAGVQEAMVHLKSAGFAVRTLATVNLLTVAHRSAFGPRQMPQWWAPFAQMVRGGGFEAQGAKVLMGELALV